MAACGANLLQLPPEILLHIFSYLQPEDIIFGVRPTCRYFHDVTEMPDLWKSVTVTRVSNDASSCFGTDRPASHFACETFFKKLLRQKCIKPSYGYESEPVGNQQIQMKAGKKTVNNLITSVEERGNVWTSCSVTRGRCYPNVKKLTLVREELPSMKFLVSYSGLVHLQLEVGHIIGKCHQSFSKECVIDLFQSLKSLTSLQVLKMKYICSKCERIDQMSITINPSVAESLKDYFLTSPKLRQLELHSSLLQNDEIFKTILDNCLQLKGLALVSPDLTPKAFAAVSKKTQKCTGLLSLRITDCPKLDDTCLEAMSIAFPYLTSLELTLTVKMTDEEVGHLLRTCCHLTFLKLTSPDYEKASVDSGESRKITGDCLKELLVHKGNLQTLVLENFSLLSDPVFKELCQHQRNLRSLELTKCRITTSDMRTLADSCPLLQTIIIMKCSDVDSTAVAFLMENLPRLQTLHCSLSGQHQFDCRHLQSVRKRTRTGTLAFLGRKMTGGGLRSLELHPCRGLTAVGVSALTLLSPNLNRLVLCIETFLSENTIRCILSNCKQLQHLTLKRLSGEIPVTEACLKDIQERGTCLQTLRLLGYRRGFSLTSLAKLLVQLTTLVECTVPCYLQNRALIDTDTSIIKQLNEVISSLTQRKKVYGSSFSGLTVDSISLYSWHQLRIRIYSRVPTTKAVK